jgi:hypothetical protein
VIVPEDVFEEDETEEVTEDGLPILPKVNVPPERRNSDCDKRAKLTNLAIVRLILQGSGTTS